MITKGQRAIVEKLQNWSDESPNNKLAYLFDVENGKESLTERGRDLVNQWGFLEKEVLEVFFGICPKLKTE